MAKIPETVNDVKTMSSTDIVNAIINEDLVLAQSAVAQGIIKEGTQLGSSVATAQDEAMSRREIGNVISTYEPLANAFINALVNRIARVAITSRLYENPWRALKKGVLELGETIEEVFVQMAEPYQFDPDGAETTLYKRYLPDVKSTFHSMNFQKFYPITVSMQQLRQAFLTEEGVSDLISRIIEQVYTGANYDEFLLMKLTLAIPFLHNQIKSVYLFNNANEMGQNFTDRYRMLTAKIIEAGKRFQYFSQDYNIAGVMNYTDPSSLVTVLTPNYSANIDVAVMATAFNVEPTSLSGRIIGVDSFRISDADLKRLKMLLTDNDGKTDPYNEKILNEIITNKDKYNEMLDTVAGFMFDEQFEFTYDNLIYMKGDTQNAKGLYDNYFYHIWKTFSISPFANCVALIPSFASTDNLSIASVTPVAGVHNSTPATLTFTVSGLNDKVESVTLGAVTVPMDGTDVKSGTVTYAGVNNNGIITIVMTDTATETVEIASIGINEHDSVYTTKVSVVFS